MPLEMTVWLHALLIVVAAYLLGSIPTGYLLVRFFRKQDIRSLGSGNIGATNVIRSGAKGLGAATFLFDLLKGVMAVLVGARLATVGFPPIPLHNAEALAALCAVLGHMFPIWLNLKGGKGVATAFGVFMVLVPYAALGALAVFVVVFRIEPLCLAGIDTFSRGVSGTGVGVGSLDAHPDPAWGFSDRLKLNLD